ncbi:photosystem I reaction center subunit V chloroplastic [Prunus yedoensis var. nudiflora]|uniref:Photosystem I reaction center subunit V, chloroplastic n=1 Tax=Prunus yedoensis var. nudiflora TaxID=2094558 RepID=A0A314XXS7_PRUYE|nr:photosystem I reaction center subunit V chloroplastic [Prunus yedoensis var. nudiflora]
MAASSSTLFSAPAISSTISRSHTHQLSPTQISFQGLRPLTKAAPSTKLSFSAPNTKRSSGVVRAELNPSLVISLSTGLSLFLGRENVAKQGLPEQNGVTHFEAGDTRAKEYVSLLKSNDPVGFNIVDVLAWGSIGHIVAYYILATSSNGYDPKFFE